MKLLSIILLAIGFSKCKSLPFENNPPFTIHNATQIDITGGMPGSNMIQLLIEYSSSETIKADSLYFLNHKAKASVESRGDKTYFIGRFYPNNIQSKADLQLHKDGRNEYGNKPPKTENNIPFELESNEAIISYRDGSNIKYVKIENIKKGKPIIRQ